MPTTKKHHPFGEAQLRLFKFILLHPGCTMHEIREGEFPDKTGNYVWNLLAENYTYIEKRVIGEKIPNQFYIKMGAFSKVVDVKNYVKTGEIKQKLVQTKFSFDQPDTNEAQP